MLHFNFDINTLDIKQLPIILISLLIAFITTKLILKLFEKPSNIPYVLGGYPFFGQMFVMLKGNPWDSMAKWVSEFGKVYKIHLFGSDMICIADPEILKVILSTKLSIFKKDLKWTYQPFLVILGNGLVTADGADHRKQRFILVKHFRTDILDFIPQMALEAFQRLAVKLNKVKSKKDFIPHVHDSSSDSSGTGSKIDYSRKDLFDNSNVLEMGEEFRHLTLQASAHTCVTSVF